MYWTLFLTFVKIGMFTIGGGYAMLPLIQRDVVDRGWMTKEDFIDVFSVAQSLPGIFAVNIAIFVGYKLKKTWGGFVCALGTILPSFVIMLLIALFFTQVKDNVWVEKAFMGLRPAVVALIAVPCLTTARSIKLSYVQMIIPVGAALLIWMGGVSPAWIIWASTTYTKPSSQMPPTTAIGFVIAVVGGICELGLVYVVDAQLNGIGLCLGLIGLLFMAVFKTVRDLIAIEKEKRLAVAASESKAKFLANMSHEIRTPINVVIGMNEMILRENKDQVIGEYAQNIKNASRMLLSLINDVLDFSKIEAGKLEIVPNEYPTASIITDVLLGAEVRAKQKQKQLQIISEIDESLPAVLYGDDIRIKQVLNNLLSNAVKYTENGSVTFSAERLDEDDGFSLRFHVKDTGIGIRNEDMEKLFGSFERLELSKNRYIQGIGLGLNIAKQLVTAMGGTIDVQSKYGIGTCFTVVIPQQIVDDTPMNEKPKAVAVADTKTEEKKHFYAPDAKVLAVDDNKLNLKVIQALMKRSAVQLDLANGGEECLQMTKDKKYDLILMDHMMPEPDGIQTLHMLKDDKTNINCDTKVIVLTANAIEGMHEEYLKEGFEDYLSKPVEVDKLESVLAKYIG